MFLEGEALILAAHLLIKEPNAVKGFLRRLQLRLTRGKLQIAIFGPGGVGKTTMCSFLAGQLDPLSPKTYKESVGCETFNLGPLWGSLLVPPGQKRRRVYHWADLFDGMERGSVAGLMNVVSWGYQSLAESDPQGDEPFRLDRYLASKREEELQIIDDLVPRLRDAKRRIWMVTVVTKQDLWWNERHAVRSHYMDGEYDKRIRSVLRERGERNFRHEYVSVAPLMLNFCSADGKTLAPTTGGYDDNTKSAHQRHLLELIDTLGRSKS
jgi:GTPase SAR1 family protein